MKRKDAMEFMIMLLLPMSADHDQDQLAGPRRRNDAAARRALYAGSAALGAPANITGGAAGLCAHILLSSSRPSGHDQRLRPAQPRGPVERRAAVAGLSRHR
jgi:hypothetical protein